MSLDPRTKLFLLLVCNLSLLLHLSLKGEVLLVSFFLLLIILEKKYKLFVKMGLLYLFCVSLDLLLPESDNLIVHLLSFFSVGLRMMLPCLIAGAYAFASTSASQMAEGMRRLKIPEFIVIPSLVLIRFFPSVKQDYLNIRDCMSFRGLANGKLSFLRHPFKSLEYVLIPLLMNANFVAEDLSVAALSKGLAIKDKHTCLTKLNFTSFDLLACVLVCLPYLMNYIGII